MDTLFAISHYCTTHGIDPDFHELIRIDLIHIVGIDLLIHIAEDLQVLDNIEIALFLLIGKRHPHDQDDPCDSAQ